MTASDSSGRGAVTEPPAVTASLTAPKPAVEPVAEPEGDRASGGWTVLASPASSPVRPLVSLRRIVVQAVVLVAVVIAVVGAAAVLINQRIAKQEAVHEVARTTDLLAESVVQPALTDAMADSPTTASAVLSARIAGGLRTTDVARVKLWTPQGLVLYSDEKRLIGKRFALDDDAVQALTIPQTQAGITDSSRPENAYESSAGKLLEVYRPVWTPSGKPLLFEAYYPYHLVNDRTSDLWRGFSGIMLSSLAAVLLILLPLLWMFYRRARSVQAQREAMMRRAMEASTEERRRIAATLHDGVVQQLAGAAFALAGEARQAGAQGNAELADRLVEASATVRDSVAGMRSLLVDIYPPSLRAGGLPAALNDLATTASGSDARIEVDVDPEAAAALDTDAQRAAFRVAQESLRNALKHARATVIRLELTRVGAAVRLDVSDDGAGFDPEVAKNAAVEGHLGLQLMADVTTAVGGTLAVCNESGARLRMEIPVR
jgi:two-component system NarL family sensor kinase